MDETTTTVDEVLIEDPAAQRLIDRQILSAVIHETRKEVASFKVQYRLAVVGLLPEAVVQASGGVNHPVQVKDAYARAQRRLDLLLDLYASTTEAELAPPSGLEIPSLEVPGGLPAVAG